MDETYATLNLTEKCHCVSDFDGEANNYCDYCDGSGEVVSDNGRELLRFIRKNLFKDAADD